MSHKVGVFALASGEDVAVRAPSLDADLERLVAFLSSLPAAERNCLRYNVTEVGGCRIRLGQLDGRDHFRLVAEVSGTIVGDATLDREPYEWTRHVGQVRVVVTPGEHELELTTVLFRELHAIAEDAHIELLFAEVMPEQGHVISALEQCGFKREATLHGFARDQHGAQHDLLVYTTDISHIWDRLADLLHDMDVRLPP